MTKKILSEVEAQRGLADRLAHCDLLPGVGAEGPAIAYDLAELEESFRRCLDEQLPKLAEVGLVDSELRDVLLEIADELRHIVYHARNSRFFRSLLDQSS